MRAWFLHGPPVLMLLALLAALWMIPPTRDRMRSSSADCGADAPARLDARSSLDELKVVNYYPSNNVQTNMWTRWDPTAIDRDFGRVADLHANAVRVVAFTSTFGYPDPEPAMLDRLSQLVTLADAHGLRVQLTLFGFFTDYLDTTGSVRWAEAVLGPYANDPRIAFIDLQNEIDVGNPRAVAWAERLIPCVREIAGGIPITASVSGAAGVDGLGTLVDAGLPVDFYDLHYYGSPELAYRNLRRATDLVGQAPLFIGETGYSTLPVEAGNGPTYTPQWWEAYQDQYHRTVQYAARALGLPAAAIWILNDFARDAVPPESKVASNPFEYFYGLYRVDGTPKPAAASLRDIFGGASVSTAFNNDFEAVDPSGELMNWRRWQPRSAEFAADSSVRHSGSSAARISHSTGGENGRPSFYVRPVQSITPGQEYVARAWVRGEAATGTTCITLAWFDASSRYLRSSSSASLPTGTTDWRQISIQAQAPDDAAFVEIHLVSVNNSGTAWFDDVTLE